MNAITFLTGNWGLLLLAGFAVIVITVAIADAFRGNKSMIMHMLYALVTEAEKQYGSGTGALKLAAVIDKVYPKLPPVVRAFITDDMLIGWIEDALAAAKTEWEKNIRVTEYIGGESADAE
jgi:hypothetical protein